MKFRLILIIKRQFVSLVTIIVAVFFSLSSASFCLARIENEPDEPQADPLTLTGPIQKISGPISQLVNLRWINGRLETNFPRSYEEGEYPIDDIREEYGYGYGSQYGAEEFRLSFGDSRLTGYFNRERRGKSGYRSVIAMRELTKPYRSLEISTDEQGGFKATVRSPDQDYLFRFGQLPTKQFFVQEVSGTNVFSTAGDDFVAFARRHRQFTRDRLLPAMRDFGFGDLMYPYHDKVRLCVLDQFKSLDEQKVDRIAEIAAELHVESFEDREAATGTLHEKFLENEELLVRLIFDSKLPAESRIRARMILFSHAKEEEFEMFNFVHSSKLLDDADYLEWLLDTELEPDVRNQVISRFRQLTQRDISPDQPAWPEWVATHPFHATPNDARMAAEPANTAVELSSLHSEGELGTANPHTSKLIRLRIVDHQLQVDREHWAQPFGNKSVTELTEELRQEFSARNIPKSWFDEGGRTTTRQTSHATILFELMLEDLDGSSDDFIDNYDTSRHSDRALAFTTSNVRARLNMLGNARQRSARRLPTRENTEDNGQSAVEIDRRPFHFYIEELAGPQRILSLSDTADRLSINFFCESQDILISLLQRKERVTLHDIRGFHVKALKAESFSQLVQDNPDYFKQQLLPLLQHMGFQFDSEIVQPLVVVESPSNRPSSTTSSEDADDPDERDRLRPID